MARWLCLALLNITTFRAQQLEILNSLSTQVKGNVSGPEDTLEVAKD